MNDYRLAVVDKALDVIEFLSQQRRPLGLKEMSDCLKMPKATLFRYLVTLEQRGYVRKSPNDGEYTLGLKVLELSNQALDHLTVHEAALPHMRDLLDRFRETVNLGVLEGNEVVYVEILESPQAFKMSSRVGGRDYPHSTSVGKAILAFLPDDELERIAASVGLPRRTDKTIASLQQLKDELVRVREWGYAIDNEENEAGARCVGAPIFDRRGQVVAAISIAGPAFRSSMEEIEERGTALLEATALVSQKIGYMALAPTS